MPNHVYLLIRPADGDTINAILLSIKKQFSVDAIKWIALHRREWIEKVQTVVRPGRPPLAEPRATHAVNRFWQAGGGYDRNIFKEEAMVKAMEYIHYNPVRLKLVETPADWRWFSARFWEMGEAGAIRSDVPDWWKGR
jgi:putative transposase